MTTLVRTVGFPIGPASGASLGGLGRTAVVLMAITTPGVLVTAAQLTSAERPVLLSGAGSADHVLGELA
ncbi:hypothetical protein [Saccharothrix stipae]